jgi:hypothetical protein
VQTRPTGVQTFSGDNPIDETTPEDAAYDAILREKQLEILDLFGSADFDPEYDHKANRQLDRIESDG